jgi:hypothetical protein
VKSSCELGNEPSGSIKCWELQNGCTSCGLSSGTELHRVSYVDTMLGNGGERSYNSGYYVLAPLTYTNGRISKQYLNKL